MDQLAVRRVTLAVAIVLGTLAVAGIAVASNWAVLLSGGSAAQSQSQTLSAPTSVAAACTAASLQTIKVSWAAVSHATSYSVYQSTTSASSGYTLATSGVTTTSWTTGTLTAGRQYWYELTVTIGTNWVSAKSAATGSTTISSSSPKCSQP